MAISKAKCITLLNQIKIAKIGFLLALTLIIAALLAFPLLTTFVSVVWSADEIEKYPSQTQDFLTIRKESKVMKVSTEVVQVVPVPVAEKIKNGASTTGINGAATDTKNTTTTSSTPLDSSSIFMSTAQVPSPKTIPKPTQEALLNGGNSNKSYYTRKLAESTTLNLKNTGGWAPSSPRDFEFVFRAMAAIQRKPKTNYNIISHSNASTILPLPYQALPHRRRHGKKRLRFGK